MKLPSYITDFDSWKKGFQFYTTINIRFSETDMFGHVNNVSPFIYFEEARINYLNKLGVFGTLDQETEKVPVVGDLQCDFLQQMYFGEQIKLFVKVDYVGKSSIDIHYMAKNGKDDICLTGRGRIVQISSKTGKSEPFNEEQIKILQHKK
ncbi:acyl-CoA thioesterase [Alkalibacillus aidingensis]|uniref:acyl-CoA thioesterase n=1 Tax=Alkalibacillus aidingensis TaxID=2747607 RepID=UPI001660C7E2|nr:acyl-CoA thioesterase [Alkalibacillus aidingensis]